MFLGPAQPTHPSSWLRGCECRITLQAPGFEGPTHATCHQEAQLCHAKCKDRQCHHECPKACTIGSELKKRAPESIRDHSPDVEVWKSQRAARDRDLAEAKHFCALDAPKGKIVCQQVAAHLPSAVCPLLCHARMRSLVPCDISQMVGTANAQKGRIENDGHDYVELATCICRRQNLAIARLACGSASTMATMATTGTTAIMACTSAGHFQLVGTFGWALVKLATSLTFPELNV